MVNGEFLGEETAVIRVFPYRRFWEYGRYSHDQTELSYAGQIARYCDNGWRGKTLATALVEDLAGARGIPTPYKL